MGNWGSGDRRGHPSPSAKELRRPGHLAVVGLLELKKEKKKKKESRKIHTYTKKNCFFI